MLSEAWMKPRSGCNVPALCPACAWVHDVPCRLQASRLTYNPLTIPRRLARELLGQELDHGAALQRQVTIGAEHGVDMGRLGRRMVERQGNQAARGSHGRRGLGACVACRAPPDRRATRRRRRGRAQGGARPGLSRGARRCGSPCPIPPRPDRPRGRSAQARFQPAGCSPGTC